MIWFLWNCNVFSEFDCFITADLIVLFLVGKMYVIFSLSTRYLTAQTQQTASWASSVAVKCPVCQCLEAIRCWSGSRQTAPRDILASRLTSLNSRFQELRHIVSGAPSLSLCTLGGPRHPVNVYFHFESSESV